MRSRPHDQLSDGTRFLALTVVEPRGSLEEVSPTTRHQRCTVHKTANVLNKLPKSVQPAAKADLREIWTAPDRATAETAIATFAEKYGAKYDKAVTCLTKQKPFREPRV